MGHVTKRTVTIETSFRCVVSKVVGRLFGPRQSSLEFAVLLLPHGCADIIDPEVELLGLFAGGSVSFSSTAGFQEGQGDIAQPGDMHVCVIVKPVQPLLCRTVLLPIVIHLQACDFQGRGLCIKTFGSSKVRAGVMTVPHSTRVAHNKGNTTNDRPPHIMPCSPFLPE